MQHKHDSVPNLTWTLPDTEIAISRSIVILSTFNCWDIIAQLSRADVDDDFLSQLNNFDFKYVDSGVWVLADWLYAEVG